MKFIGPPSSGSVNYETYSRNRFGQYVRNRSVPVQPRSPAQVQVRDYFTQATTAWAELTEAQRDAWSNWAATHPKTDQLGQTYTMTGHQAFVGAYVTMQLTGEPNVVVPPEPWTPPATLVTNLTGDLKITVNLPEDGDYIFIYASGLLRPSINYVGVLPFLKAIAFDATSPINLRPVWEAKYGSLQNGYKVVIRACYIKAGVDHGPYEQHSVNIAII